MAMSALTDVDSLWQKIQYKRINEKRTYIVETKHIFAARALSFTFITSVLPLGVAEYERQKTSAT